MMVHGPFDEWRFPDGLARFRRPRGVIVNSAWTAGCLAHALPGVATEIVHPAVSPAAPLDGVARRQLRESLGVAPHEVVLMLVGRMEAWKGQEVLVDALERLPVGLPFQAWIVGGAQRPDELAFAARLSSRAKSGPLAGRLKLLGQRRDVRALMSAADLYCQPNLEPEPFGVALVEALAAGLPVVSVACGGALEIVERGCGELLLPEPRPALAVSLARALGDLIVDTGRRRALASNATERARAIADPARQAARLADAAGRLAGYRPIRGYGRGLH
jgi:glycosyltransferase involved in cell wall biosynthesis